MAPLLLREPVYGIWDQRSEVWGQWWVGWRLSSLVSLEFPFSYIPRGQGGGCVSPFVPLCSPSPGPVVGQYTSPTAKRCCQDGLTRLPMPHSCEQRVARVRQPACREPFLSCCQFAVGLRKKIRARGQVGLARGEGLDGAGGQPGTPEEEEWPSPYVPPPWSPSYGDPARGGPDR